jgi:hypothetical protein
MLPILAIQDVHENPNIEIRNPKQYQNPNVQNSKQPLLCP